MATEAETNFLTDSQKSVIYSIGMKRQGKTFLLLKYISWALLQGVYDEYHLVLPQFGHERDKAYQFLKIIPHVFIYDKYHQILADKMLKLIIKKHIFFGIDDATGELIHNFDDSMSKLLTCNEHGKSCAVWFNIHTAKKAIPPLGRQMMNYLFVYKVHDATLLRDIWEQRFSLIYKKFDSFVDAYMNVMRTDKNAIMYSLEEKHALDGIHDWYIMNTDFKPALDKKFGLHNKKVNNTNVKKPAFKSGLTFFHK